MVEQSEVEFEGFFAPLKRWFSVRITPTAEGIVACARDVTGWRQTRRVLTREAERLAAVIETQQAVATAGPRPRRRHAGGGRTAAGAHPGRRRPACSCPKTTALVLCEASGSGRERIGLPSRRRRLVGRVLSHRAS